MRAPLGRRRSPHLPSHICLDLTTSSRSSCVSTGAVEMLNSRLALASVSGDLERMRSIPALLWVLLVGVALGACGDDDDKGSGNPAGVGNHCERNEDCATRECYLGPGGGYCTSPCSQEGDTSECPVDTVCKPIQGGARRCLLICGSQTSCGDIDACEGLYCPQGSSCVAISNSSLRACEPAPE
jgi:hypothetical protein